MKIEKTYHFLSGLPRSGSTVLQSMLNQNPKIYASATSPLMDMLVFTEKSWNSIQQSRASSTQIHLDNIYSGVINGMYDHIDKPVIIDKHRAWARNLPGIVYKFPNGKCICTVRSIPDIIASFITIISKQRPEDDYISMNLRNNQRPNNMMNRCNILWTEYIHNTWESLKIGYESNKSLLLLIEYDDLIKDPEAEIRRLYEFIGEENYNHTFDDIVNVTPEKDEYWGLVGLHDIRPQLSRTSKSAKEILGDEVFHHFSKMNLEFWRENG